MTPPAYPRDRVEDVLVKTTLPPSCRIIPWERRKTPLGTRPGDSRFCAKADGYTVLYAAPDFTTAFVETVVRDRFTHEDTRKILLKEVTGRAWTRIQTKPSAELWLLDLRKDGCTKLGAPTDAVNARNHADGRALGRAIHADYEDVDGFLFSSRLTGKDAYAVFNRALVKLDARDSEKLYGHPELPDVLAKYGIQLIAT